MIAEIIADMHILNPAELAELLVNFLVEILKVVLQLILVLRQRLARVCIVLPVGEAQNQASGQPGSWSAPASSTQSGRTVVAPHTYSAAGWSVRGLACCGS